MSELTDKPDPEGLDLQHKYENVYQIYWIKYSQSNNEIQSAPVRYFD